jgi:hypothetical protein
MGEVKKDIAVARVKVCLSSSYIHLSSLIPSSSFLPSFLCLQAKFKRELDIFVDKQDLDREIETKKVRTLALTLTYTVILSPTLTPTCNRIRSKEGQPA